MLFGGLRRPQVASLTSACLTSCALNKAFSATDATARRSFLPPPPAPPPPGAIDRMTQDAYPRDGAPPSFLGGHSSIRIPGPPKAVLPSAPEKPSANPFSVVMAPPDVEFCFWVQLDRVPPPPEGDNFMANRTIMDIDMQMQGTPSGAFSVQDFVGLIPAYFVPVDEVLKTQLEGYTDEHINMYFGKSRGVQIVTVGGRRYMRLFGGYSGMDMARTYEADEYFGKYKIDPSAAAPYIAAFQNRRNTWMPLRMLMERGGLEAEKRLPYGGPVSLLFFAQMQHIFAFAPDNGGAVQLRDESWNQLDLDTSPCPGAAIQLVEGLGQEIVDMRQVPSMVNPDHMAEVLRFFPTLEAYLLKHAKLFYLDTERGVLMRTRVREREELKKLPLEKQLELAFIAKDKKRIRNLRRKMQVKNNPNNPLLERDTLAKEIFNFIPKKGYITMSNLARNALPVEYLDFMGKDHIKFLKQYPQYFQVYELREATKWCISRVGVQLPQGVLRTEYTEEEVVRVMAAALQRRGNLPATRVALYIPDGCREYIRRKYTGVYYIALKYPQYFSVMRRSENGNSAGSSIISLIAMPVEGATADGVVGSGGGSDEDEYFEDGDE